MNTLKKRSIPIQIVSESDEEANHITSRVPTTSEAISPLERLVQTHPIWLIPDLSREEAVRILHAKQEGVSIVYTTES